MTDPVYIVQFPHPGSEHRPRGNLMPWNTGQHARKFMVAEGRYRDETTVDRSGKVVFWGEWEGPSRVLRNWPAMDRLPRFLHDPFLAKPPEGERQNTDPWIFGDSFHYSNCKQRTNQGQTATAMQRLTPGSVIFFGSRLDEEFALDTVFVIGDRRETWIAGEEVDLPVDPALRVATLESLASWAKYQDDPSFTLYWGVGPADPIAGMFSFVPCLPFDGQGPRFARPILRLPRIINPDSWQSTRGSGTPRSLENAKSAWESAVAQVMEQDLLLATRLELSETEAEP